jgi:hypothetical protein
VSHATPCLRKRTGHMNAVTYEAAKTWSMTEVVVA